MPVIGRPPNDDPQEVPTADLAPSFTFEGVARQARGPGGDGVPRVDFPRIDTSKFEAPERNEAARRRAMIAQALGAFGAISGASADAPLMTRLSANLAGGAREGLQARREDFQAEQEAFQTFLQDARSFNRRSRLAEAEATAASRRAERQREFERSQAKADRQLKRELDEPTETEKAIQDAERNLLQERAETEEAQQFKFRQQGKAATQPDTRSGDELPDDPQQLRNLKRRLEAQADALRTEMPTGETTFGEPRQPVLRRQLSERIAEIRSQIAAVNVKLDQVGGGEGEGRGRGGGDGSGAVQGADDVGDRSQRHREINAGQEGRPAENRGGAAPPDRTRTRPETSTTRRDTPATDPEGGLEPLTEGQKQALMRMAPDSTTATMEELINAVNAVRSDTTTFTPQAFEQAYGFNPFQ